MIFDDRLIKEFMEWKEANPNSFTWWNYVNIKADLQTALAFAKFYYPDIIEVEGYFLLKDKFSEQIFLQWKEKCNGDKNCVERMMNLYELKDFFHINSNALENEEEQLQVLGKIIIRFWSMSFKERFPNKNIKIEVFNEFDSMYITVYEHV